MVAYEKKVPLFSECMALKEIWKAATTFFITKFKR